MAYLTVACPLFHVQDSWSDCLVHHKKKKLSWNFKVWPQYPHPSLSHCQVCHWSSTSKLPDFSLISPWHFTVFHTLWQIKKKFIFILYLIVSLQVWGLLLKESICSPRVVPNAKEMGLDYLIRMYILSPRAREIDKCKSVQPFHKQSAISVSFTETTDRPFPR